MRKEISKAVDIFHKIAFKNSEAKKLISDSQIGLFISFFTELLIVRFEKFWFPDEPDRASGFRCIRVNTQSFDPLVAESLKKAGVPANVHQDLISNEVTVWVDPGVVSMRIGEDGSIGHEVVDEELYLRNMARRGVILKPKDSGDSDVDEGIGSRSPSPPDSPTTSHPPSDFSTPPRRHGHIRNTPSPQEYNPYTMTSRVCNARTGPGMQSAMTPPHPPHLRTASPPANLYQAPPSAGQRSHPMMPSGPGVLTLPPAGGPGLYANGHIPVSSSSLGGSSFPSARRSVFGDNGGVSHHDSFGKMAASRFPMNMDYAGNPSHNYISVNA